MGNGPEVGDAVLDGRAGEDQAGVGAEAFDGLGVLGAVVLDGLGLVKDDGGVAAVGMEVDVAPDEGVARDDEVDVGHLGEETRTVGAGEDEHAHRGHKLRGLAAPVLDQRGGADDEGRHAAGVLATTGQGEPREGLQGLAQAHLVGQDATETALLQEAEPVDALLLIRTQRALQRAKVDGLRLAATVLAFGAGTPIGRGLKVDALQTVERGLDKGRVDGLDAGAAGGLSGAGAAGAEGLADGGDGADVQQGRAALFLDVGVAAGQGALNLRGGDRDGAARGFVVGGDLEAAALPVAHPHHRHDDLRRVPEVAQGPQDVHAPAFAAGGGDLRAEQIAHAVHAGEVAQHVAARPHETHGVGAVKGGALGLGVAHKAVIEVVGVGLGDVARGARGHPEVAVAREELGGNRGLGTAELQPETRRAGGGREEVGRHALGRQRQRGGQLRALLVEEGEHALTRHPLGRRVERLEGHRQDARQGSRHALSQPESRVPGHERRAAGRQLQGDAQGVLGRQGLHQERRLHGVVAHLQTALGGGEPHPTALSAPQQGQEVLAPQRHRVREGTARDVLKHPQQVLVARRKGIGALRQLLRLEGLRPHEDPYGHAHAPLGELSRHILRQEDAHQRRPPPGPAPDEPLGPRHPRRVGPFRRPRLHPFRPAETVHHPQRRRDDMLAEHPPATIRLAGTMALHQTVLQHREGHQDGRSPAPHITAARRIIKPQLRHLPPLDQLLRPPQEHRPRPTLDFRPRRRALRRKGHRLRLLPRVVMHPLQTHRHHVRADRPCAPPVADALLGHGLAPAHRHLRHQTRRPHLDRPRQNLPLRTRPRHHPLGLQGRPLRQHIRRRPRHHILPSQLHAQILKSPSGACLWGLVNGRPRGARTRDPSIKSVEGFIDF